MKRLTIAILIAAVSISCFRKTVAETDTPEQVLGELRQLQSNIVWAVKRKDMDALDRYWAKEYLGTAPDGRLVTKADLMSAVKGGAISLDTLDINDLRIRLFDNVALLTGRADVKGAVDGVDQTGSYKGTGIYVKRDGHWQAVGVQVALDKAGQPAGK